MVRCHGKGYNWLDTTLYTWCDWGNHIAGAKHFHLGTESFDLFYHKNIGMNSLGVYIPKWGFSTIKDLTLSLFHTAYSSSGVGFHL
jgi:hypothetical protein